MSETLIANVQNRLNEKKFTRALIGSYSIGQFEELDKILKEAKETRSTVEIKEICDEFLSHTKNSIDALYISGMIALSRQIIDDGNMVSLVNIFADNHKTDIVKYLCGRILDFGDSRFALRTLGDCYKNDNQEEAMYETWQRLVKIDYEEVEIARSLGERFEKAGDLDQAIEYYRKALHRSINKGIFTNVREIWQKLLEWQGDDVDFFLSAQKKVAKNLSEEKASLLLQDVYETCRKKGSLNTAITVLKMILDYNDKDRTARQNITECFRKKYEKHSLLEEYIRISNLTSDYRNVHEAITDFEKHIAFDKGNFVFHRTWGVGRIQKISGDEIVIDFTKKRDHKMSLKMAIDALQTLPKTHIWVLKATKKPSELHDMVKNEPAETEEEPKSGPKWALKTIIRSYNNACSNKQIKAELVPSVLSAGEWTSWNNKIKEILANDTSFGVSPADITVFTVRERPNTMEEKLYNEFKAEKDFTKKVKIFRDYMEEEVEPDSESFQEMLRYFTGYAKAATQVQSETIASYLFIEEISKRFPGVESVLTVNFIELFDKIDDVSPVFSGIKDALLRKDFLGQVKLLLPAWPDVYVRLFPKAQSSELLDSLLSGGFEDKLVSLTIACFGNYRDREARDTAVWLYKNYREAAWFKKTALSEEKVLVSMLNILDGTNRDIDNHRDTTENRKTNKQAYAILFKDGLLTDYLDSASEDGCRRVYTLVDDVKGLDPADKIAIAKKIQSRYPNFKVQGTVSRTEAPSMRGLTVTAEKLAEKQKQLAHILNEEVPANSREIGEALKQGDLSENAEYKAAKEKQEELNAAVARIKGELERAQIFDPATVNTSRVSFGTVVTLETKGKGKFEKYTILGPWESDPENNIISYLSPFGSALWGKKLDETFSFGVGEDRRTYSVRGIDAAK